MPEKELASSYLKKACEISNILLALLNPWHLCVIVLEDFSFQNFFFQKIYRLMQSVFPLSLWCKLISKALSLSD